MLHVTVKLRHKLYRAIRPSAAHIAPSALLSQSKDQTLQFSRPDNDPVAYFTHIPYRKQMQLHVRTQMQIQIEFEQIKIKFLSYSELFTLIK